jgi:hypothetical protein
MRKCLRTFGLAIALAAGYAVALPAGPASAHDKPSVALMSGKASANGQSFTMTLTRKANAPTPKGQAAPPDIIYCGGYVTYPYQSGSSVRADAVAQCSAIVDSIDLEVGMFKGGFLIVDNRSVGPANYNSYWVTDPCQGTTNTYSGAATAVFTKAGYANSPLIMKGTTPQVSITC